MVGQGPAPVAGRQVPDQKSVMTGSIAVAVRKIQPVIRSLQNG
jgi:hypothetical protein